MLPVTTVGEVLDALRRTKAGASAFCTNLYVGEARLQAWIQHNELFAEEHGSTAFFLKPEPGFWHLYFCSGTIVDFRRDLEGLASSKSERVVIDVVGGQSQLEEIVPAMVSAGFRRYTCLQRMVRLGRAPASDPWARDDLATYADLADRKAVESLLNCSFDPYADQLPAPYEIQAAIEKRQLLAVRCDSELAALMFFETQGFTSTVRYWVVSHAFRACGLGSALMRRYFSAHQAVRRFMLWVRTGNAEAVLKYKHYGYAPDGLLDLVLVNELIPHEGAS